MRPIEDDGCGLRTRDSLVSLGFVIWVLLHRRNSTLATNRGRTRRCLRTTSTGSSVCQTSPRRYFQRARNAWAGVSVVDGRCRRREEPALEPADDDVRFQVNGRTVVREPHSNRDVSTVHVSV